MRDAVVVSDEAREPAQLLLLEHAKCLPQDILHRLFLGEHGFPHGQGSAARTEHSVSRAHSAPAPWPAQAPQAPGCPATLALPPPSLGVPWEPRPGKQERAEMTFPVVAGILAGSLSSGCPGCGQGTTAGKHGGVEGPALETQRGVCCGCVRRKVSCPLPSHRRSPEGWHACQMMARSAAGCWPPPLAAGWPARG